MQVPGRIGEVLQSVAVTTKVAERSGLVSQNVAFGATNAVAHVNGNFAHGFQQADGSIEVVRHSFGAGGYAPVSTEAATSLAANVEALVGAGQELSTTRALFGAPRPSDGATVVTVRFDGDVARHWLVPDGTRPQGALADVIAGVDQLAPRGALDAAAFDADQAAIAAQHPGVRAVPSPILNPFD